MSIAPAVLVAPAIDPRAAGASPLDQLRGEVPISSPPRMFHAATALSAFILLLLPAIYLGVAGLVGWLTFTHIFYSSDLLFGPRINFFTIAVYLIPSFIGVVLFFFMIKPLFNWQRDDDVILTLSPDDEPMLFAYVERLCDILHAPMPDQIDVDLRVNASANMGRLGLFGNRLTLTLGLPLIHGLNLAQFTGVLAHELGHFTQSKSLRLTNWVRTINIWFIRVVHERDWFDAKLDEWTDHGPSMLQWIFGIARFFVWVTRRVLHLFMMLGHAASCLVARQSEFDADRFQTHTAGSASFADTMHKISILDYAHAPAIESVEAMWREKRLGDNLPRLVVAKAKLIPKDQIQPLIRIMLAARTQWHDTHPSMKDRLRHARSLAAQGIIQDRRPARELFRDFENLCRGQTTALYRLRLGKEFDEKYLIPAEKVVREWSAQQDAVKSLRRYFQDAAIITRPLFPAADAGQPPADPAAAAKELRELRQRMVALAPDAAAAAKTYDENDGKLLMAKQARLLSELNIGVVPEAYNIDESTPRGISRSIRRLEEERDKADLAMAGFDLAAKQRFTRAIQLAHLPVMQQKLAAKQHAIAPRRIGEMLALCESLRQIAPEFKVLRQSFITLVDMLQNAVLAKTVPGFGERVMREAEEMTSGMKLMAERFASQPYPFDHLSGELSIGQFIMEKAPDPQMLGDVAGACAEMLSRLDSLLTRALSQLAVTAEQVEAVLGLPPLTDPPEGDELNKMIEEMEKAAETGSGAKAALASAWNGAVQIGTSAAMLAVAVVAVWGMSWLAQAAPTMAKERKQQRVQQYERLPSYQPPANPHAPQPWQPPDPLKPNQPQKYDPTKPYQPYQPPNPNQPTYPRPTNPRPTPSPPRPSYPGPSRPSQPGPTPPRPGR